jgi:arabinoxylan arabinofuranohydrolase
MLRIIVLSVLMIPLWANAGNPIIPNKGVNDPHIHIFEGRAYLYATHDRSIENTRFAMDEWGVWSSGDLVNWTVESILKPEDTYIGRPYDQCWATDAAYRDGKYYLYFSEQNRQTGVVVGESPAGPWKDVLGKPLLPAGLTSTHSYDPAVFLNDDGEHYIIFGVWDFYIARLNHDMISLAEEPKRIKIHNPRGPYNQDGTNKEEPTDDKPFVHKYNGKYYLSWGAFYAMSDNLYGPYDYVGTLLNEESFAPGYAEPTWPNGFLQGRHGSFFQWHNQWYFAYCDISQTGNRRFRDTFISYVHYKENGEIAPLRVDGIGVGEYDANQHLIEAEDYFKSEGFDKVEMSGNNFAVRNNTKKAVLVFPNIHNLSEQAYIELLIANAGNENVSLQIRVDNAEGKILAEVSIPPTGTIYDYRSILYQLSDLDQTMSFCFVFDKMIIPEMFRFDGFLFHQ